MPVLDPVQQIRIESLHRGFLYQHLFAVGCLLLAAKVGAIRVSVEKDEDIEVEFTGRTLYIQVKTRGQPLSRTDTKGALERFSELRAEHAEGRRLGNSRFLIIANQPPSPSLAEQLREHDSDVTYVWPSGLIGQACDELPPAWNDLTQAAQWCIAEANQLPYRMIASDSLVWKLAGQVTVAASGSPPYQDHAFAVEFLPALFEQVLMQLQDFPEPLQAYRPHTDEPAMQSEQRLRIVSGFSGAGKTSWAAQAAVHCQDPCAYYDAGETPGSALASALVRELAAKLLVAEGDSFRRVLMPGSTPLESLRMLDHDLGERGLAPFVVIDNGHSLPARNVIDILQATRHMRLVLLCQPTGSTYEIEAQGGISREDLKGWEVHEVAQEAVSLQCHGNADAMERLRVLCAGLPLYVQGACRVAAAEHSGDIAAMCESIDQGTHLSATPQEVILRRVFQSLKEAERNALSVLSVAEIPLSKAESDNLLEKFEGLNAQAIAVLLRSLRTAGIVQVFGSREIRVHDAIRILGVQHLQRSGGQLLREVRLQLKEIIIRSLEEKRDASRFGFLTRVLIALEDIQWLIGLMGEEMFHEIGVASEVTLTLQAALEQGNLSAEQEFWACDGLVFAALRNEPDERVVDWLERMRVLLAEHRFARTERLSYLLKKMLYQSALGDAESVKRSIGTIADELPNDQTHQLIFKYNAAAALFKISEHDAARNEVQKVIKSYFERLKITPGEVVGKSQMQLWNLLDPVARSSEDVKHLADALELFAMIQKKSRNQRALERIHAMKFFALAGAIDSLIRAGQDAADDFVGIRDYQGAKEILEQHVLPVIRQQGMVSKLLDASTQYAVVLAYCGQVDDAEAQMTRIEGLLPGATPQMRAQVVQQKELIANVRRLGPPNQSRPPNFFALLSQMLQRNRH